MLLGRVNREVPEKIFISVKNVEGATITTGFPVSLKPAVASLDGVSVVIANAAGDYPGFIGVAKRDIANNDYGLVQIAGPIASLLVSDTGTSVTFAAGDPLVPSTRGFGSAAPSYAASGFRWIIAGQAMGAVEFSNASFTTNYISGLMRLM